MKLKTGIYGGSFNPIHNGHIFLAKKMLEQLGLDEIWFVVSPQNPLKSSQLLLDDEKRLELVRMALENEKHLIASDYEFHLPKPSYTWTTLEQLSSDFQNRTFMLLIGADNWSRFGEWYRHDEILGKYDIAVYPRNGFAINEKDTFPNHVKVVKTDLIDVSSTQIRQLISEGRPFRHLLPPVVADAIISEGLYQKR